MQNNAPQLVADSSGRLTGMVYTQDEALGKVIDQEVQPVCRIAAVTASKGEALRIVEDNGIQACFVHVCGDTEEGMTLVGQLRRTHPEKGIFIVTDRKDPDLILQGFRLGAVDVIPPAVNGNGRFLPSLQKALGSQAGQGRNAFVYALFSIKGGQGVTSLSLNLADQIHDLAGGRVLLIDLNLYMGDVAAAIDLVPDFTPFDLIRDMSRMDENLLLSSLHHHERGFYVLPAPASISDAERINRDQISVMLALLKRHFNHIVIDLPHELSERTLAAAEASDQLLVLVEADLMSVKSAQQVLTFFQELNYGDDRLAFVLNRLGKDSVMQPDDVRMVLKQPLIASVANDWTALSKASRKGEPLSVNHGRRRITQDIRKLAGHLTGIATANERKGLLSVIGFR